MNEPPTKTAKTHPYEKVLQSEGRLFKYVEIKKLFILSLSANFAKEPQRH